MTLTARDRARLRALANHLKPILQIGHEGITEPALRAIVEAFNQRELIKIRVQEAAPLTAREAGPAIAEALSGVEHVQTIGRVVVLFRKKVD